MGKLSLVVISALAAGCFGTEDQRSPTPTRALGGTSPLVERFVDAEKRTGVPAELLATLSYVETRLRARALDGHSHSPGGDLVDALHHLDIDGLADALWLAAKASDPVTLDQWLAAIATLTPDPMRAEVRMHLSRGWQGTDRDGNRVVLSAQDLASTSSSDGIGSTTQEIGYPGAIWSAANSSNYSNSNRGASGINYIVIHTTQGSYAGAISWFKNSTSNVSAHYVIRSSDGEVTQMVDDRDIAWHDACFNTETIGIEHEGFVQDPQVWYTETMYMESAKVTAWLADQYNIPKDRNHIFGHGDAPDCSSHTDPGSGWDWDHYMALVQSGGAPTYDAAYVGHESPTLMYSGEEAVVYVEYVNHSNITWGLNETRLGTTDPADRASPFYVEGNWLSPSRPTGADHSNYAPGSTGRFTFLIRAPQVDEPTTFNESFQLVQEGDAWFGPNVTMTINVVPEGWDGDPDPDDHEWVGDGDQIGGQTDQSDGSDDGTLSGGCRAADGGAGTGGCAILLIGALLFCRRRSR